MCFSNKIITVWEKENCLEKKYLKGIARKHKQNRENRENFRSI